MLIASITSSIDLQAKLFRGFADSSRLSILEALREGERTVSDIVQTTGFTQPNVSNHLSCLRDCGLVTALEMLTRETGAGSGLTVRFECKGVERRLDPALELALYRIAQEALNNVTRHAAASQASVCVTFRTDHVVVGITDNGRGFTPPRSPADFAADGHFGLLGMHERAELVGAKMTIVSALGAGTSITITV